MKLFALLILTYSIMLGAENWKFVKDLNESKYFANADIAVIQLGSERVAQIQSKVVSPRGGISLSSHYWRKRQNHWEASMKTTDLYRGDGSLRSHQIIEDSKLSWVIAEVPTDDAWVAILNHAAALLQGPK